MFQLELFSMRGKCLKAHCFINSDLKSNFLWEPVPLKQTLILEANVVAVKVVVTSSSNSYPAMYCSAMRVRFLGFNKKTSPGSAANVWRQYVQR